MAQLLYSFQRCFAKLSASDIDQNEAVGNTDLQRKIQWFCSEVLSRSEKRMNLSLPQKWDWTDQLVWAAVRPVPSWCIKSNSARSPGGWWVRPGTFQTACWQAVSSECAEGCCRDSGTLACWIDVLLVDFGVLSELLACKSLTFLSFHALKGSRLSRLSKRWGNTIWTESQLTCIPLAYHWQSIGRALAGDQGSFYCDKPRWRALFGLLLLAGWAAMQIFS